MREAANAIKLRQRQRQVVVVVVCLAINMWQVLLLLLLLLWGWSWGWESVCRFVQHFDGKNSKRKNNKQSQKASCLSVCVCV